MVETAASIYCKPEIVFTPKIWELDKQSKNRFVRYSEAEELLFGLLNQNESITLNYFKRKARLSHKVTVNTLANMALFDLVQMKISEESTKYFLNKNQ